jgi:hypothetical protein
MRICHNFIHVLKEISYCDDFAEPNGFVVGLGNSVLSTRVSWPRGKKN